MTPATTTASVYTDFQGLSDLKRKAQTDTPEALDAVARQFESLFVQMMLKGMRDAKLAEGVFDSDQMEFYQDLHDRQLSLHMTGQGSGIGIAEVLVRQLKGDIRTPSADGEAPTSFPVPERTGLNARSVLERIEAAAPQATEAGAAVAGEIAAPKPKAEPQSFDSPAAFVRHLWPHAERAAARLGVDPRALIAQAALETGWGKHVIRRPDGNASYNLFNIKADHRWEGDRVAKVTLEYRDGVARKEKAPFRAYGSWAESFDDYVSFLQGSTRYREALKTNSPERFIEELHKAGYATDPAYAPKIKRIMNSDTVSDTVAALKGGSERTLT